MLYQNKELPLIYQKQRDMKKIISKVIGDEEIESLLIYTPAVITAIAIFIAAFF